MDAFDVAGGISPADVIVMKSALAMISTFVTDAGDVVVDASFVRMDFLRTVANDISIFIGDFGCH